MQNVTFHPDGALFLVQGADLAALRREKCLRTGEFTESVRVTLNELAAIRWRGEKHGLRVVIASE